VLLASSRSRSLWIVGLRRFTFYLVQTTGRSAEGEGLLRSAGWSLGSVVFLVLVAISASGGACALA
jgi:hypothetical protein